MGRARVKKVGFENDYRLHLKLNKFLLTCLGLWPYQSTFSKRCTYLVFATWTITCLIPMMQGLGDETSTDVVVEFETIVALLMIIGSLAQCTVLYFRSSYVKKLYDRMKVDWESIDAAEKITVKQFSRQARLLNNIFVGVGLASYVWFIGLTYLPLIINKELAGDYSKIFPYYSQRWIIAKEYRNLQVFLHAALGCFYAGFVFLASTTCYMSNAKHICAMYEIVGLKLRHLLHVEKLTSEVKKSTDDEKHIVSKLLDIIDKHREAIESVRVINRIFSRLYLIIEIGFLACLAMIIFDFNYYMDKSLLMSSRIVSIICIFISYVFSVNYAGEQVIKYSSRVLTSTYHMQWDLMSNYNRKILLLILQRSLKHDTLDAGIMICSLENFTKIIKVSWSLACMLLSTQKK